MKLHQAQRWLYTWTAESTLNVML